MRKYRVLVSIIIVLSIAIIGTSDPAKNLYKATNLISKYITKDDKDNKNNESKNEVEKDILICIDPGHQEKGDSNTEPIAPGSYAKKARVSSGATGVATKKPEYILNLEASTVLKHILEDKGYKVIMTRESHDVNISNSERAIFANDKKQIW